jgi:hypothetical protein
MPHQCITLTEAIAAYTQGSAAAAGLEGRLGTLEPGMPADLIVLDRPLNSSEDLLRARVVLTMMDGIPRWEEEENPPH